MVGNPRFAPESKLDGYNLICQSPGYSEISVPQRQSQFSSRLIEQLFALANLLFARCVLAPQTVQALMQKRKAFVKGRANLGRSLHLLEIVEVYANPPNRKNLPSLVYV